MATARTRIRTLAPWLILAALAPVGCSSPGPLSSRQTTMGSLKASVSQLEFENDKLRKEVGELKADNSRLDTMLAQEKADNDEKSARLDDAKDLIRRQGGNAQAMGGSSKTYEDDAIPPPVATPKTRTTRGARKPPAATLPQIDSATPFGSSNDDLGAATDFGPDRADEDRWLPIARGLGSAPVRQ